MAFFDGRLSGGTALLTAILIMSLVMTGAAAGLTTAIRVYRQMTLKADAETLLGTTITVLSSELRTSSKNNLSEEGGAQTMEIYCEDQKMYLTFSNDPVKGIQVTVDNEDALVVNIVNPNRSETKMTIRGETSGNEVSRTIHSSEFDAGNLSRVTLDNLIISDDPERPTEKHFADLSRK
ncbi:hypothetical protein ACTQ56_01445 [[Clostridium] aminophilum]|uniref:hypothetical protein n=1 Tax=[Clostridium] aminophilum TaxID=1526 RepID=UPI003F99A058